MGIIYSTITRYVVPLGEGVTVFIKEDKGRCEKMFPEPLLEQRERLYQLARIVERACGLGFYSPEDFLKFLENTECYMAVQDAFPGRDLSL